MKKLGDLNFKKIEFPKSINFRKIGKYGLACMSYLFILVIVPLFFMKKNEFISFHARQGLALMVLWVIWFFTFFFPYLPVVFAFVLVFYIIVGIANVLSGKIKPLPIIGRLSL